MSTFYTDVTLLKSKIHIRGYSDGKRFKEQIYCEPYIFLPSNNPELATPYRNLKGQPVHRVDFKNVWEAREFLQKYKDVSGFALYGMDKYQYPWIYDNFPGKIDYDPSIINIWNFDIECRSRGGFPNIQAADREITVISTRIRHLNEIHVFTALDYVPPTDLLYGAKVILHKAENERQLLAEFMAMWTDETYGPDIITGWRIRMFDLPYMINRIAKLFGPERARTLSPYGILKEQEIEEYGKPVQVFTPLGIAVLDGIELYKKFTQNQKESWSLEFISQEDLGEGKIDYHDEYGDLDTLMERNPQLYCEYNVRDVNLVHRIDAVQGFMDLVFAVAYDAKVNYMDTLGSVRTWDVIIHNDLLSENIVVPMWPEQSIPRPLPGAFVKESLTGLHKWVVSFDLTSLYPKLIIMFNISPETFVGKLKDDFDIDAIVDGSLADYADYLRDNDYAIAANLCVYRRDVEGFLPRLMAKQFDLRDAYKKKYIQYEQEYEANPTDELKALVDTYYNAQWSKKIQLNSAYGSLANVFFRWYDINHAEAITASGQMVSKWVSKHTNAYFNKLLGTTDYDYVIHSDTDSMYLRLDKLVERKYPNGGDPHEITEWLHQTCLTQMRQFLDRTFDKLATYTNAREQSMSMKREIIADRGVWKAKKRYALNMYDKEGVRYETPKVKIIGLESVSSGTPKACRKAYEKVVKMILTGSENDVMNLVRDFRDEFMELSFDQIGAPTGVNGLTKYEDAATVCIKGTPYETRGALIYNKLLKDKKLTDKYRMIVNGDKVKVVKLISPNPSRSHVLATHGPLPPEFHLEDYVDREAQFEATFLKPVRTLLAHVGWEPERRATLKKFFL